MSNRRLCINSVGIVSKLYRESLSHCLVCITSVGIVSKIGQGELILLSGVYKLSSDCE